MNIKVFGVVWDLRPIVKLLWFSFGLLLGLGHIAMAYDGLIIYGVSSFLLFMLWFYIEQTLNILDS